MRDTTIKATNQLILFLKPIDAKKSERKRGCIGGGDEALEEIRIIFQERVDEVETDEDREKAKRELRKVDAA
ncbi:hypothetical protein ACQR0Z_25975 [Bradyrhizobium sp. HKCCYLS3077]|uniref:hypothetical protein n=1 Tax=Bradyrhizobium sp. HKCCYLS3077 TaxID=3420761 RepID=UPI003EB991E6